MESVQNRMKKKKGKRLGKSKVEITGFVEARLRSLYGYTEKGIHTF